MDSHSQPPSDGTPNVKGFVVVGHQPRKNSQGFRPSVAARKAEGRKHIWRTSSVSLNSTR
jgi:hypothetical protein